jgi:hypothetical protein
MMRRYLRIAAIVVALAGCATSTPQQSTASPATGASSMAHPPPPDTIVITGNTSNDNAILVVDGRRNNCRNDEVWRGSAKVDVGNLRSSHSCNSEIVVFTTHYAMQLNENVLWSDSSGDQVSLPPLAPPVSAPVFVWVAQGTFPATQAQALTDVARGNMLYGTMNCGIQFTVTTHDATADPQAPSNLVRRCDQASTLRAEIGFMPGQINVYYIAEAQNQLGQTGRGAWCGSPVLVSSPTEDDKNTILISTGLADNETLAHEVGHALSLGHTNAFSTIPSTNLMNSGGVNRDSLTEGQCFRCNVNPESAANRLDVRVGPVRQCPDTTSSVQCPPLPLDVNPNN